MRDRSIRITMGLVFGTLMVIGALSVATTLWTIQTQQHDAAVVNLTGRQRMLSQKLVKEIWSSLLKGLERRDLSQIEATTYELEALRQTLVSGGQVSYASTTVLVPPASDPAFRAALEKAQTTLELLRRAGHAVLENEPGSPAFVQGSADLERLSSVILEELDQVTLLYQTLAEAKVTRLAWLQLAFLLGGASTLAAGTWLILTQVLRPVNSLEVAVQRMERGDLDSPVQVTVRNELGRLAQTFDVMRARVKEQITELVALNRASQAITSSLNIREVLDQIVDLAGSVVDAAYVSIMLVKEDGSLGISAENFRRDHPLRPESIPKASPARLSPAAIPWSSMRCGTTGLITRLWWRPECAPTRACR